MQGLSVLTDPEGNPKTVMIDLQQHDSQLNPLVAGLLDLLKQQQEDDEPEYTVDDLISLNPDYKPL